MVLLAGLMRCTRWGRPILSGCTRHVVPYAQPLSTGPEKWLKVTLDDKTGIATLTLQRSPANTLNLEYMTDIAIALEKLDNDKHCRALVLASGVEGVYSGGLELTELYNPRQERVREVWRMLQEIWIRIYGSRLATVAAINGHAFAGGCLLSLSCDYRVMAEGKVLIALNGVKLGIVPPSWLQAVVVDTIGHREAEWCVGTGHIYTPAEALSAGLVDEVVPLEKLASTATQALSTLLKIPEYARQLSKENMRRPVLESLLSARERDTDAMVAYLMSDGVQKLIGAHIEALRAAGKDG